MFLDITKPLWNSRSDSFILEINRFIEERLDYRPMIKTFRKPTGESSTVLIFANQADVVMFHLCVDMSVYE